jgi:hypothetical protein
MGPFTYRGVIIDNFGCDPQSWNNHGSLIPVNNRWYIFYHRSSNGTQVFRKTCVEPVEFDDNGLIKEVEMISQGAGEALNPFAETEARLACTMSGNVRITTFPDGQERLAGIKNGDMAAFKYFNFTHTPKQISICAVSFGGATVSVYADSLKTGKLCELKIKNGDGKTMQTANAKLLKKLSTGKHALYFSFSGKDDTELLNLESFSFK